MNDLGSYCRDGVLMPQAWLQMWRMLMPIQPGIFEQYKREG